MFLSPTPPKTTRRRKLEHIWLLILRCLILLALAAGFARPFLAKDIAPPDLAATRRQVIIMIDTSASMRRAGLWNKARGIAGGYLEKTAPQDEVAVMTFDRQPHTVVSMAEWSSWPADQRVALARERLDAISPGWMGTELGPALVDATRQFEDHSADRPPPSRRNLVLISDLQEGAKLDGVQGHEWPKGLRVIVERVEPQQQSNAGLEIPDAIHRLRARDQFKGLQEGKIPPCLAGRRRFVRNLFAARPDAHFPDAQIAAGDENGGAPIVRRRRRLRQRFVLCRAGNSRCGHLLSRRGFGG